MIRERLVGTWAGHALAALRGELELLTVALSRPEQFEWHYNDHLCAKLLPLLCGGTFVDIGAHIGSISAAVRKACPKAKIIAIEAVPEKAAWLKRRFPSIEVCECAVADRRGKAPFFIDMDRSGYSSLLGTPSGDAARSIMVELIPLDELLPTESVSLIKIDVEGAEISVLCGASALTARCRPLFVFESALRGDQAAIWHWFADRDYGLYVPSRVPHDGEAMGLEAFLDCHPYPRRTTNYFAIPREKRVPVRDAARKAIRVASQKGREGGCEHFVTRTCGSFEAPISTGVRGLRKLVKTIAVQA